jgi:hypothetical protein
LTHQRPPTIPAGDALAFLSTGGAVEAVWRAQAGKKQTPKGGMNWETTQNRTDCLQNQPNNNKQQLQPPSPSSRYPRYPPPHGDTLIAFEKLKQEKNNEGREKDFKRNRKFDICVGKVQNNCN